MTAIDLIGYGAAFGTTFAFVPQALKSLRERDTRALSLNMYLLFNAGVYLWAIYGFIKGDVPLLAANVTTAILSTSILIAKLYNVIKKNEPK